MTDETRPVPPRENPEPQPAPAAPAQTASADGAASFPAPPPGPHPQSAFTYPAAPPGPARRSWRKRTVLLLVGAAVVVSALLFGGGFWAGSVATSNPGISDGRFGDDPRMGPGGPGERGLPGREDETDGENSTDSSSFIG